ncbi:MAG: tRNA (guanosine(46)-N7)-methyltransferase TrmB [Cyanobacteria bacterium P01_D01_bin.128]
MLPLAPVRVRQHVNPLSDKYRFEVDPPDWAEIYAQLDRPLHLDIGCGRGQFLFAMAKQQPEWNYLGLEIRAPLVTQALDSRDQQQLTNLHFVFCNANITLQTLFTPWPNCPLQRVSIQFPDPWFKKRHQKRRVVQPALVDELATLMCPGADAVLQSDIEAVAVEMSDRFREHPRFQRRSAVWEPESPFPAMTEREALTLEKGQPVFRSVFTLQVP